MDPDFRRDDGASCVGTTVNFPLEAAAKYDSAVTLKTVVQAQAGIHSELTGVEQSAWIPTFVGTTVHIASGRRC
jgi:hypothetical protein